jgi:hypothetical protein
MHKGKIVMKKGIGTGLYDRNGKEIKMGDRLKLFDSDGRVHRIKVGFNFGMFIESGTGYSLFDVVSAYNKCDGGDGVEIY